METSFNTDANFVHALLYFAIIESIADVLADQVSVGFVASIVKLLSSCVFFFFVGLYSVLNLATQVDFKSGGRSV